jgi:hypothetical protein
MSSSPFPRPYKAFKRHVILLELLIAMALTMILVTAVMGIYRHVEYLNAEGEKAQQRNFKQLYLSGRLAEILPKAIASRPANPDFLFFSSNASDGHSMAGSSSLIFTFDNGVKLSPDIAGTVVGKLYLDKNKSLSLAVWPSFLRWKTAIDPPIYHEVLFDNVEQLAIEYYVPPDGNRKLILDNHRVKVNPLSDKLQLDNQGGWRKEWLPEYSELPPLIKLTLTLGTKAGEKKITLTYPLPNSNLIILYGR